MNAITGEIAEILAWELSGENIEDYREFVHLSDIDLLKLAFDRWCQRNYEVKSPSLPSVMNKLSGRPCGVTPSNLFKIISLFKMAMATALDYVDWDAIAADEDIAPQLNFLRGD